MLLQFINNDVDLYFKRLLISSINIFIPFDSIEVLCASSSGKSMEIL